MRLICSLFVFCLLIGCATTSDIANQGPAALLQSAEAQLREGDYAMASRRARRAYEDAKALADERQMGDSMFMLAKIEHLLAGHMLREKRALDENAARNAGKMAVVTVEQPDVSQVPDLRQRAIEKATEAIEHYQRAGWTLGVAVALAQRGNSYQSIGENEAACSDYRDALSAYEEGKASNPDADVPVYAAGWNSFPDLVRAFQAQLGCP